MWHCLTSTSFPSAATTWSSTATLARRTALRSAPCTTRSNPAVLELIARDVAHGRTKGTEVGLCGDMASDSRYLPAMLDLGLQSLSVAPPARPGTAVKAAIPPVMAEVEPRPRARRPGARCPGRGLRAPAPGIYRQAPFGPAPEDRQGHRQAPQFRLPDHQPGLPDPGPGTASREHLPHLPSGAGREAGLYGRLRGGPSPPPAGRKRQAPRRGREKRTIEIELPWSRTQSSNAELEEPPCARSRAGSRKIVRRL